MASSKVNGNEHFSFNGIDACSGRYLFPPMSAAEIVEKLQKTKRSGQKPVPPGTDAKDLSKVGWGVIFHRKEDKKVREALAPLLAHRKAQAGKRYAHYYKELSGAKGYRDGLEKDGFLCAHKADPAIVNPNRMPYYLLLVGGPERIPFRFQHQLDTSYAVGRIAFDTADEYARYAESVVAAETSGQARERRAAFFGARNPDDDVAEWMADRLVRPLAKGLRAPEEWQKVRDWQVDSVVAKRATKARLGRLMGGKETPALLFTACHGMGFPNGHRLQRSHQGALLCQNWPGPNQWRGSISPDLYFSADDVNGSAHLHGLIAFLFACHGAGTPALDEFAMDTDKPPQELAPEPFISRLSQRLLAHPNGGALAVIGHVERAWAHSFLDKLARSQIQAFDFTLRLLMDGYSVGHAMEWFHHRYSALAADLTEVLQRMSYDKKLDPDDLAGLWIANNDARNYVVIGDPAVRVKVD